LAALAHFARCLGRRDDRRPAPAIGGREFSTDLEARTTTGPIVLVV